VNMQFEPGAKAAEGMIGLCEPYLAGNEWAYVKECLDTAWVSSAGKFVERFESDLAAYLDQGIEAVAMVNGTAALHIALLVAGVQPGDEVLLPALTFIAPANAVRYCGALPVFIDVDPQTWQLDPARLDRFLNEECEQQEGILINRTTGNPVKAILPVHLLGHPVDLDPILAAARRCGLLVIEDATESLGARYKGELVGTKGDIGCFSFNGNKLITTGGGGMLVTNQAKLAAHARYLSTQAKDDPVEYIHGAVGFNYRLNNLQAAMGCAQLEQIREFIQAKLLIAETYDEALSQVPGITLMPRASWAESVYWLYTVLVNEAVYGMGSRDLMAKLAKAGIQTRPLWQPLHQSPAMQGCQAYEVEEADKIQAQALSLPSSVGLGEAQQEKITSLIAGLQGA
jgi:perosamine synthetase